MSISPVVSSIKAHGGNAFLVGGCVRDSILGVESKDIDIEVFGISIDTLKSVLSKFGKTSLVGESFGVIKFTLDGEEYDFSVPRKDSNNGAGHKDIDVELCPNISVEEAASRRDFTINSMLSTLDGVIIDPFGGLNDIADKVLRHTSDAFVEDPLRVLRGMQFCGRFGLTAHNDTLELCRNMVSSFDSLSPSRLFVEFEKLLVKSTNVGKGLDFLVDSGWIECFPALDNILGLAQEPQWHPEGCTFTHTKHVCNAMKDICDREGVVGDNRLVLMFAALLHDVGKFGTTAVRKNRIVSPGHAQHGVPIAKDFLDSILCPHHIRDRVLPLVAEHMFRVDKVTDKAVRRLALRLGKASIRELLMVMEADVSGRPPLPKRKSDNHDDIMRIASNLNMSDMPPVPIVSGRHLIDMMSPGPDMGSMLRKLFDMQLDGAFDNVDDGVTIAKSLLGE